MLKLPEADWLYFFERNLSITLVSVISSISENILKYTRLIEIFRISVDDLPKEFLYVNSAFLFGYNFDKNLLTILSYIGEKTPHALLLIKYSEDYVL